MFTSKSLGEVNVAIGWLPCGRSADCLSRQSHFWTHESSTSCSTTNNGLPNAYRDYRSLSFSTEPNNASSNLDAYIFIDIRLYLIKNKMDLYKISIGLRIFGAVTEQHLVKTGLTSLMQPVLCPGRFSRHVACLWLAAM